MKLNIDELEISSFATADAKTASGDTVIIADPNDPTAATWCYYCPPETFDGCW
jgi:hypothetical protein